MKTLLPHQIEDAAFLAAKAFAGNFSGMGSGKTLTALEAIRATGYDLDEEIILIVGPPISLQMWKEEFETWISGLSIAQIVRTGKEKLKTTSCCAFIMSYDIATKRRDELKALGAKVLICDEAHALFKIKLDPYTKQPSPSQRTQAILGAGGICESVDYSWFLTGTPVTRYNCDMWTFFCRADMDGLKKRAGSSSLDRFYLRYCVTQQKRFSKRQVRPATVVVGNRNTEELNEWLFDGSLAIRRELADVWAAMPPITINRLQVSIDKTPELRSLLKVLDGKTMNQIREDLASKEEHISTTRRLLGIAKVKASVSEIVDRVEAGIRPILVGAWHIDVIDELVKQLIDKGVEAHNLDGRTVQSKRDALIESFNGGTLDVLVGQISAMGVSISLVGGSHIIVIEEDWSPSVMDQFFGRCLRIGQPDHVHVDIFASDTKLDKAISKITAAKRRGHAIIMEQANA